MSGALVKGDSTLSCFSLLQTHDSPPPAASINAPSFSSFPIPSSPIVTMSTSTLFFRNLLPSLTRLSWLSSNGDPTKTTIL